MAQVINLTPHDIKVVGNGGETIFPASGTVARVATEQESLGKLGGIPLVTSKFGKVEGLPEPQDGVLFLVSALVASAEPHRLDLLVPNTAKAVRDQEGRITGVPSLIAREGKYRVL